MARIEIKGKIVHADCGLLGLYGNALAARPGDPRRFARQYSRLSPARREAFNRLVKPDRPLVGVFQSEIRRRREHPLRDKLRGLGL